MDEKKAMDVRCDCIHSMGRIVCCCRRFSVVVSTTVPIVWTVAECACVESINQQANRNGLERHKTQTHNKRRQPCPGTQRLNANGDGRIDGVHGGDIMC